MPTNMIETRDDVDIAQAGCGNVSEVVRNADKSIASITFEHGYGPNARRMRISSTFGSQVTVFVDKQADADDGAKVKVADVPGYPARPLLDDEVKADPETIEGMPAAPADDGIPF